MSSDHIIIVAGGSGKRLESNIPKQFLIIGNLPILMHTILAFSEARVGINIVVVLPQEQFPYWSKLCNKFDFNRPHQVVAGGATRFQSVRNGLDAIHENGIVGIHDGVRPFVPLAVINTSFDAASQYGNAVVAVPSKDSLRRKSGSSTKSVDRSDYFSVQTPQVFKVDLIKRAFLVDEKPFFTDDASVFEYSGQKINLVAGSYQNIKITTKEDLIFAEALLKAKS